MKRGFMLRQGRRNGETRNGAAIARSGRVGGQAIRKPVTRRPIVAIVTLLISGFEPKIGRRFRKRRLGGEVGRDRGGGSRVDRWHGHCGAGEDGNKQREELKGSLHCFRCPGQFTLRGSCEAPI